MFKRRPLEAEAALSTGQEPSSLELLAATIAGLHKPASLQLAERNLSQARKALGEHGAKLREALSNRSNGFAVGKVTVSEKEIVVLSAAEAPLKAAVAKARADLHTARAAWAPKLIAELLPHRVAAARKIVAAGALLAEAAELLRLTDEAGRRNGIEVTPALYSPNIAHELARAQYIVEKADDQ
jgi:hypothetical protein